MRKPPSEGRRSATGNKKSPHSDAKSSRQKAGKKSTSVGKRAGNKAPSGASKRTSAAYKPRGGSAYLTSNKPPLPGSNAPMRLNRFISNAGVCSRREADVLIQSGAVKVNGELVVELGMKVTRMDTVQVGGESIRPDIKRYVLLNKPKGFGTTASDFKSRRGVMELVQKACKEEIRPIDKMDRESTGLMLITNDEPLAVRMNDPRSGMKRLYHVVVSEKVNPDHLEAMKAGFVLDEGFVKATAAEVGGDDRHHVGLETLSSRSQIARRMLEHFGYKVLKVDRVKLGPLTKKNVPRGTFRHLTESEVNLLRMSV